MINTTEAVHLSAAPDRAIFQGEIMKYFQAEVRWNADRKNTKSFISFPLFLALHLEVIINISIVKKSAMMKSIRPIGGNVKIEIQIG